MNLKIENMTPSSEKGYAGGPRAEGEPSYI